MVNPLFQALEALYVFIPAFAANSAAVLTGGHGKMDFGRNFVDGKRILGDGKTWSGFIGGTVLASILGLILYALMLVFPIFVNYPGPILALYGSALLAAGSLTGDAFGSFIKRRIGIQRGGKGYLLDQLPFVIFALIFATLFYYQFFASVLLNLPALIILIVITPPLHKAVNVLGYKLNRKDVPW